MTTLSDSQNGSFNNTKNGFLMSESTQNLLIEKLSKENNFLKEQITIQTQAITLTKSVELTNKINRLNDSADGLVRKIQVETRKLDEAMNQNELLDAQLMDARIDLGGIDAPKENKKMIQQQVKVLENRLDTTLKKFNEAITTNQTLRKDIQNLREERSTFDNIYKKMEMSLFSKKQEMAECIELSNTAYEERDSAVDELKKLLSKRQEEKAKYSAQLAELDDIIKTDELLNEKFKQAEKERTAGLIGNLSREEETRLKSKVIKGNWNLAEQAARSLIQKEKSRSFMEMFQKIEGQCGCSIDNLIEKFKESEDANYSLFTFVNELNTDIEKLENQIQEMEKEYHEYDGDEIKKQAIKRQQEIDKVKTKLQQSTDESQRYVNMTEEYLNIVRNILCPHVRELFTLCGGNMEHMISMLGTEEITENNVVMYLGIIEQRVHLLTSKAKKDSTQSAPETQETSTPKKSSRSNKKPSRSNAKSNAKLVLSIRPPSTGAESDDDMDDDEEEKPLTREELLSRFSSTK